MKNDYDLPNMLKNCELRTDRQNFFSGHGFSGPLDHTNE